jgi:exonuclease SbcC
MIPISLSMTGFLSYKETVEIDFTSFDLACISGNNGAGKSAILDAITWALFGRARKHDESIINLESTRAEVIFIFHYEGNQYRIVRSNPRGGVKSVEFQILQENEINTGNPAWLPLTERTLRETNQIIEGVLRLDYESFINASFLLQGEADHFTQQNPSVRKRILSQILGLEIWENYRRGAAQKRKYSESEIDMLDGRIAEILAELEEEELRKKHLLSLENDLAKALEARMLSEKQLEEMKSIHSSLEEQQRLLDTITQHVNKITEKMSLTQVKLKSRENEKKSYLEMMSQSKRINKDFQDLKEAQKALSAWENTAEKFREQENKRQEPLLKITAEKARLLQEMTSLESQYQELKSAADNLPTLIAEFEEQKDNIKQAEAELENRDQKKKELDQARQQQADAKAENPRLLQEMKDLEKRIHELGKTEGALCPLCGQELSQKDRESLIQSLKTEGKDLGDRFRENKSTLEQADQVVKDLQLQITAFSLVETRLRNLMQETGKTENRITQIKGQEQSWESQQKLKLEQIQDTLDSDSYAEEPRKLLSGINADLKIIGYDAAEHDRVREVVMQGAVIQDRKGSLDSALSALKPLEREIKDIAEILASDQKDLEKQNAEIVRSQLALDTAKEKAPDIQDMNKTLLQLKEKENILQREAGAAQQKVAVLEIQKARKIELEEQRQEISNRVKQYKQLEDAFGKDGVPALLIEQALPNIEAKANQILERLSGGAMSIRFLTQRSYKDSNREDLKETLDIQIRDQSGFRDYEMYSGGEAFRINFAIRLALSHVLAQRAGARLQTLVVDEGFGSQDAVGRQRLIEAINLIQDDFEKILVITHVEQIKEAFSTQLFVEKTPLGSQVTLV